MDAEELLLELARLAAVRRDEPDLKAGGIVLLPVAFVDGELLADADDVLALARDLFGRALLHAVGG